MKKSMKRIVSAVIGVVMVFAFAASGCGGTPGSEGHVHSWSTEWSKDAQNHWHDCDGCDETKDLEPHSFSEGECTVCGQADPDYDQGGTGGETGGETGGNQLVTDAAPTIFLAGDSTVKTYEDGQYIAGWGQYLDYFLDESIEVVNAAQGGRSTRSFINEGRLYDIDDPNYNYSFSQNGGNSIESTISEGDFLFIQFGHNDDDTKKQSSYSTMYNRMVPLGTPDAQGIYPVTAPEGKQSTTYLPQEFIDNSTQAEVTAALTEIAKYGDTYYAYDCGATYKWFLKQYVDFARENGAMPVLVTPVARVKFNSDGTLQDGPGLHGDDFAYVKAVRQLAEEEDVLLVDLFDYTKDYLETATSQFANYLMALVPNELTGSWPSGYDNAYGNAEAGFEKIEATHYNKYGAFITAAAVAETILEYAPENAAGGDGSEYFNFTDHVLTTPESYIDPSNRMSISVVGQVEDLLSTVNPTNPDRTYKQASEVVAAIEQLTALGEVTAENYLQLQPVVEAVRAEYESLNYDYRGDVTNLSVLEQYEAAIEAQIEAARPKPVLTVVVSASDVTTLASPYTVSGHTFTFTSDLVIQTNYKATPFSHNGVDYAATTQNIYLNGNAGLTGSTPKKYIEFNLEGPCRITIAAQSTGADTRTVNLVKDGAVVNGFAANSGMTTVTSADIAEGGIYRIGSAGSNIALFYIIIEYFE